ncbi:hypothetical protein NC651_014163 [Populus alba x Populus x berolinensis]|nr:hypothetical protein NC651_014163 [Populus alba x Populus x berolinensis]
MGQDYVKRMEADSNTFRKQRGSYNEVVVKVALTPCTPCTGVVFPWPSFLFFKREKWEGEVKAFVSVFCSFSLSRSILSMLLCHVGSLSGAACPGTFQGAAVIVGYAVDICSPKSTSYHDSSICGFCFLSLSSLRL